MNIEEAREISKMGWPENQKAQRQHDAVDWLIAEHDRLTENDKLWRRQNEDNAQENSELRELNRLHWEEIQRLISELASVREEREWTDNAPTRPGLYWYLDHHNVIRYMEVVTDPDGNLSVMENSWCGWKHVRLPKGVKWVGPISKPLALPLPEKGVEG